MKNSFKFLLIIVCLVLLCFAGGCKEEENVRDSIGQDASFQEVYDAFLAQEEALGSGKAPGGGNAGLFLSSGWSVSEEAGRVFPGSLSGQHSGGHPSVDSHP